MKPNSIGASLSRSNLLVGGLFGTKANNEAKILPIGQIEFNREQPRRSINQEKLDELAEDIRLRGILQPLIVRPISEGEGGARYRLVVGERRFRAAQQIGLEEVPVIIREYDEQEAGAVSLVENLLREDLDLEEEALYFKKLTDEYNLSTRDIGKMISKGHQYVYRRLKLLERPELLKQVQEAKINLNKAVEMISEEKAEAQAAKGKVQPERSPNPKTVQASSQATWKKMSQLSEFLRTALPKFDLQDEKEREGLKETITELEQQLAELKKRLQ